MKQLESIFLWIVKIGLWAIPFLPIYIEPAMLFPFITGKNFAFRMIVEILFAVWSGLAVMREEFRPKLTPVFKTATIFIAILFLADIFSPNPYRSLFSNYERMEGFMMLFNLYLYFVMLVSVFRRRDWIVFFHTTLIASVFVSYVAFLQKLGFRISMQGGFRVDSTIGNPTYLAAYLVFHLWILLLLAYNFWSKWWAEVIYALIFIFEFIILYFTATRGAILAVVLTGFLFLAALVVWWKKLSEKHQHGFGAGEGFKPTERGRVIAASLLAITIAVPLILWLMRGTSFIQENQVLRRLTNYSFQEDTIRARRMIWGMSLNGVLERPFLGWGQENYYLVFQKYYNPGLWSQEPWFDRSHNIVFDWLIHAGILGFAAFFAMIGAMLWGVFQALKKQKLPFWAGLVIFGVFVSHIIQDIFVFDNINTYILFFAFLAYANFMVWGNSHEKIAFTRVSARAPQGLAVSSAALAVLIFAGYFLHVKPINESKALIAALTVQQRGSMDQIIGEFQKALAYNSFGNTEVREQIGNLARSIPGNEKFTKAEQQRFIEFAVNEFRIETAHSAKDVKHLLFYGAIIDRALDLKSEYAEEGVRVLKEAVDLSPKKQMLAFELAQMYMNLGKNDLAAETLRDAWRADHSYPDARANAWVIAIIAKKPEIAAEISAATDFSVLKEPELYRIAQAYQKVEEYKAALPVYAALVKVSPTNPKYHAVYAAHLAFVGKYEEARAEAREAMKLDPNFKAEAETFLESIRGK